MFDFFAALFWLSILGMIVGSIKPTWVQHWGKDKTKRTARRWYGLFALLCFIGAGVVMDKTHPAPRVEQVQPTLSEPAVQSTPPASATNAAIKQAAAEAEEGRKQAEANRERINRETEASLAALAARKEESAPAAKKEETAPVAKTEEAAPAVIEGEQQPKDEAFTEYCAYVREYETMAHDLDCSFGFDPKHGRQPGETITLESDLVGTSTPKSKTQSGQGTVKYFAGTKIKILERYFYWGQCPDLLYRVSGKGVSYEFGQFTRGNVEGYVEPIAIRLRADETRYSNFVQKHDAIKEKKTAAIKKKFAKLLTKDVEVRAFTEDWWGKCLRSN